MADQDEESIKGRESGNMLVVMVALFLATSYVGVRYDTGSNAYSVIVILNALTVSFTFGTVWFLTDGLDLLVMLILRTPVTSLFLGYLVCVSALATADSTCFPVVLVICIVVPVLTLCFHRSRSA